jgi:multimeric flavodoxin WrbA
LHFISLVASRRRRGNSEILGKLALNEAFKNGADSGELVYLKDFAIEECQGCMRCVFKDEPCSVHDDIYKFFDKMTEADALFVAAPTYVLSIPGILKLVIDRYLLTPKYYKTIYGRPAMSVGTAGLADWIHFQLPLMNLFLLALGFRVIDSFMAIGAGPGEVLLNNETISRIKNGVQNMLDWKSKQFESQISEHCPVCFSTIFERIEGSRFRCPVCFVEAEQREKGYYFDASSLNNHRWTPPNIEDHFENWVKKTKVMFREKLREILQKKKKLEL